MYIATTEDIEARIDKDGLASVIQTIAQICYAKHEHVLTKWQDKSLARLWEVSGNLLWKVSSHKAIQNILWPAYMTGPVRAKGGKDNGKTLIYNNQKC